MPAKVGERVGALLGSTGDTVTVLGYGVYEGHFFPEEAVGMWAEMAQEVLAEVPPEKHDQARQNLGNPRIRLDSGEVVYGCECWWGAEEVVREKVAKYPTVVETTITRVREDYRAARAARAQEGTPP